MTRKVWSGPDPGGTHIIWHGPEPNAKWRARAIKEAEDMIKSDLACAEDLISHDVWDEHPDERPRIMMWGEEGDTSFHAEFLPVEKGPNSECQKCGGSGFYHYDNNHATFCDECCNHEEGWWQLPEEGYGDSSGMWNCKRGCGKVVKEKPVEKRRMAPGKKEEGR